MGVSPVEGGSRLLQFHQEWPVQSLYQQRAENTLWVLFCNLSFRPRTTRSCNWIFLPLSHLSFLFLPLKTHIIYCSNAKLKHQFFSKTDSHLKLSCFLYSTTAFNLWRRTHGVLNCNCSLTSLISLPRL